MILKEQSKCERVIDMLPASVRDEVLRMCKCRRGGTESVREIRLRVGGCSTVRFPDETLMLLSHPTAEEMADTVHRLSDGAIYAHKDSICSGYVSVAGGIRVGLVGTARYERGEVVGISDIRYALFRFPSGSCEFTDELSDIYRQSRGMLIYSPPGVGKTTALRALAKVLGGAEMGLRVAVIDERFEFDPDDYLSVNVDILRGYKRREGIEIATRTMSPDVIMIDELGSDDAAGISEVVRCGVPIIATAHASSAAELESRSALSRILSSGAFDTYVGISRDGMQYRLNVDKK